MNNSDFYRKETIPYNPYINLISEILENVISSDEIKAAEREFPVDLFQVDGQALVRMGYAREDVLSLTGRQDLLRTTFGLIFGSSLTILPFAYNSKEDLTHQFKVYTDIVDPRDLVAKIIYELITHNVQFPENLIQKAQNLNCISLLKDEKGAVTLDMIYNGKIIHADIELDEGFYNMGIILQRLKAIVEQRSRGKLAISKGIKVTIGKGDIGRKIQIDGYLV